MRYLRPEMDVTLFAKSDILTDSNELPIVPSELGEDLDNFDEPVG